MDRRGFRSADNVQRDGLMGVAAEASDLKVAVTGVESAPSVGDGCAGPLKPNIRWFPRDASELSASLRASLALPLPACGERAAVKRLWSGIETGIDIVFCGDCISEDK
jgi:hypothetical protein